MPNTITSSPNIAVLDSKIIADLCSGYFKIDLTPSVWIATGYDNVLGAKVQVTNPYGVIVRPYPTDYDITPAFSGGMEAVTSIIVPIQANNYQYGKYIISVQLTDADGTLYTVTKTVSICAPNSLDKTKKYGTLSAKLTGVCNAGKVYVLVDNVPNYKGYSVESSTQDFTLDYPTGSGKDSFDTGQGSFSIQLYEGVYKISGEVCATYNYGDNVYANVKYNINYDKPIVCSLDEQCVFSGLSVLYSKLTSDCSESEKRATQLSIERATLLINLIYTGVGSGQDVSAFILDLEDVLQVSCSCTFDNGTPITNNDPSEDILIQGCNVDKEVVGLTTVYTINNYSYSASVSANGGVLNVNEVVLNGCVQSQNFTFNIAAAYTQIKELANTNTTEANYWAAIIKKSLNTLDASCLDLTSGQLAALSFESLIQKIVDKACSGASCESTVDTITATQNGGDVTVSWTQTDAYSLDIYVDGVFYVTVLNSLSSYPLTDYADSETHTYRVVSKCSNGVYGTALQSTFGFAGCPTINAPSVSMSTITSASCPYDLTGLVSGLPMGITSEWHTANNHLGSSLVPNESSVTDGIYYVFATDGNNCYSASVKVTVTCATSSSCSVPQNLAAVAVIGGLKLSFQSAVYPPPANSYTLKRKVYGTSDSTYITLTTPVFNVSTSKWETLDTTASANTLYTYQATSNCTGTPLSTTLDFAKITCPTLTLTSDTSSIDYSFTGAGGAIDKYEVQIWDSSGITLEHTDTFVPTFSSPITGSFTYLTEGTTYKVRVVVFIGTYSVACSFTTKAVLPEFTGVLTINNQNFTTTTIDGVTPIITWTSISGFPVSDGNSIVGVHGDYSGSLQVVATVGALSRVEIYKNSVLYQCSSDGDSSGIFNFASISVLESDNIELKLYNGDCS